MLWKKKLKTPEAAGTTKEEIVVQKTKLWIAGEWKDASQSETFDVLNPLDDSLYARAAKGTTEDMNAAVNAAKQAFLSFKNTTPKEREGWLIAAAEIMIQRKDELINCLIDEVGAPITKAMFEFDKGVSMLRAAAGLARQVRGETIPSDVPGKLSMSIRAPRGVVAVITPFNVPLIKTSRLTANALAVGNTVVQLPSELSPRLTILMAEIYHQAGLPAGAFNVVSGFGYEIGDALTGHPDVDFVTFTGSTVVGQHILEVCSKNKTPNTLELGGKSPTVILADADIDKLLPLALRSIYMNAGQACIGSSRFYVERPVFDEFCQKFAGASNKVGMGDLRDPATVIAPIISERQRNRVKAHIEDALSKGATLLAGGEWVGNRCQPTVLTGVTEEMVLFKEETFGPVTAIYPIESYEEGLERANDTDYGLSSAIFTNDINKALHFAQNIEAGMCHVNGPTIQDEPHVPFGGNGESGVGREGTDADLEAMTEVKWVTIQL